MTNAVSKAALKEFSIKLQRLMVERNISQSDLARVVWGERVDPKTGYNVAKNRDAISNYLRGTRMPEPRNLAKIATALGVEPDELAPEVIPSGEASGPAELSVTQLPKHPNKVLLEIHKVVPFSTASKIMALLVEPDEAT